VHFFISIRSQPFDVFEKLLKIFERVLQLDWAEGFEIEFQVRV
jgi:hypothetical protein